MFVPLMFGDLAFGVDALAFQKLTLTRNFSVAKHTRIGTQPTLQFTGRDGVSVELPCALFPARIIAEPTTSDGAATVVGFEALDALRDMAARGESYWLVVGNGDILGKFAVESVTETQTTWLEEGTPLRVEFSLKLTEDSADAGEANEASCAVLNLNRAAREARAKAFSEAWDRRSSESTTQTVESVFSDAPTAGKWYRTKQGDVLGVLCGQANPDGDAGAYLARTLSENAALADEAQPFSAGTEIFFPAEANTQSTLTTSLFESTFLSRLI